MKKKTSEQGPNTPPRPAEKPEDKFIRIASGRMKTCLTAINTLIPLAGSSYAHTGEQVDQILEALRSKINEVEAAFRSGDKQQTFTSFFK